MPPDAAVKLHASEEARRPRIHTEVRAPQTGDRAPGLRPSIELRELNLSYGDNHVLFDVSMDIGERMVTALIGPSGCGKSTLIRCLNRMNDLIDGTRVWGQLRVKGSDIYAPETDVIEVRRRIGMVFQKSNPFRNRSTRTSSMACASRASPTRPPSTRAASGA